MAGSPESDMAFEVGKHVSVELKDGATLRGFVHAQDSGAGLVCLELAPSAEVALISTANVKAVSAVADLPEKRKWPVNPVVDVAHLQPEQHRIFKKWGAEFEHIGVGVTANAQAVFDALVKTLPCEWDKEDIVVLKSVRLAPPYDVKSISGEGEAGVIQRVKIILEHEAKAIKSASDANGVTK